MSKIIFKMEIKDVTETNGSKVPASMGLFVYASLSSQQIVTHSDFIPFQFYNNFNSSTC